MFRPVFKGVNPIVMDPINQYVNSQHHRYYTHDYVESVPHIVFMSGMQDNITLGNANGPIGIIHPTTAWIEKMTRSIEV